MTAVITTTDPSGSVLDDWPQRLVATAKPRSQPISDGAQAALDNALVAIRDDPLIRWGASDHRAGLYWQMALRLSPSLEVFEALLRGEKVPRSRLDPTWAKAYGL